MAKTHRSRIAIVLFAGMAVIGSVEVTAQPHAPPPAWKDPSGPPTEMHVWLRRLAGRFRYEGTLDREPGSVPDPSLPANTAQVEGLGDCVTIGAGPGVHCVINLDWPPPYPRTLEGVSPEAFVDPVFVANLDPAMILFGIDAGASQLAYLQVNQKGLAEPGTGVVVGNIARFEAPCVNTGSGGPAAAAASAASLAAATVTRPPADTGSNQGDGDTGASESTGSTATSEAQAIPDLFGSCQRYTYITAKPDRDLIEIRIEIGDRIEPSYVFLLVLRPAMQLELAEGSGETGGRRRR